MNARVLCVRLDSAGDVLLAGPAVRAVAASADPTAMLVGPAGAEAAAMLPGVDDVIVWSCPWIVADPGPVDRDDIDELVASLAEARFDAALVFTSFHQSPLPAALVLRLAGVPWVGAISVDYPGSLLDLRHRIDDDLPEAERALSLASAAGYRLPDGDDGRLGVRGTHRRSPVDAAVSQQGPRTVVVHPGTSVPARAWPAELHARTVRLLGEHGYRVVVTGGPGETALTAAVAGDAATDLGGRTTFAELAEVMAAADVVVAANTGPAHLAAAVGSPVVSLFAPTVPAVRWAPYGVASVVLGDQEAPCRDTRATICPVPGHPCLTSVTPDDVVAAVDHLSGGAERATRPRSTEGLTR